MSSRPSHLQTLLRVLRHMLLVLGGMMGVRAAALRARRDALPLGHRRRAVMAKELRRIAWAQEMLADPDLLEDAAFRGLAAERARVRADAGRRALVRRYIYPTPLVRLRGAVPAASLRAEAARCMGGMGVAAAPPGTLPRGGADVCTDWVSAADAGGFARSRLLFTEPGLTAGHRCGAVWAAMPPGGRPK